MAGRLYLGARDWQHPAWQDSYYPEDLPAEWRLAYYANEYRAVLVPAARWGAAGAQGWAQWLEDTDTEFRFVLEWGPVQDAATVLAVFGERLSGLWLPAGVAAPPALSHLALGGPGLGGAGARVSVLAPAAPAVCADALRAVATERGAGDVFAFLAGDPPPPAGLAELATLAELLGL